jgi:hypothetical protein
VHFFKNHSPRLTDFACIFIQQSRRYLLSRRPSQPGARCQHAVFSEAVPMEACETSPEVTSHSIVRTLNFSSADNAGVILARLSFLVPQSEGAFIERTERSPCLQSAWRTPTDGGAEPFFERSRPFRIFVLDLLPRRLLWSVGVYGSWRRERGSWQPRWGPGKLASFS